MTDQRLRDLERGAAHGDLQAQARLLLERVCVGDLTEERLRLAAYCGDEAARLALDAAAPQIPGGSLDWLAGLRGGPHVVTWRAALAALDAAGPGAAARVLDQGEGGPTAADLVRAVTDWVLDPDTDLRTLIHMHGWPIPPDRLNEPPVTPVAHAIIRDATDYAGADTVLFRVQAELIDWALGLRDPVRDRGSST